MRPKIPVGVMVCLAIWLAALCVPTVRELPGALNSVNLLNSNAYVNYYFYDVNTDILHQFPNEPTSAAWAAEDDFRHGDANALKLLLARFPDNLQVHALLVRMASENLRLNKVRKSSDENERQSWIQSAQLARAGAVAEPDNVFWPWMEAAFWMAAGREDAGFQAWNRTRNCTRYQDYARTNIAARIHWLEARRALTWEQKISLLSGQMLSHLAPMQTVSQRVTLRAKQLQKSGQIAEALKLEASVLNAAQLCHRDQSTSFAPILAEGIARQSLKEFFGIAQPRGGAEWIGDPVIRANYTRQLARAWADFARQHQRPELAGVADWMNQTSIYTLFDNDDTLALQIGLDEPWSSLAINSPVGLLTLRLILAGAALLWIAGAFLRFKDDSPTRGQVIGCANFSFWLLVGCVTLICWRLSFFTNPFLNSDFWNVTQIIQGSGLLTISCWLLPICLVAWHRNRKISIEKQRLISPRTRRWIFGLWAVSVIALTFLLGNILSGGLMFDGFSAGVIMLAASGSAVFLNWRASQQQFAVQLAHRTLGISVVVWSAVFLLIALSIWPLRAQLNRTLERQLEIGEVASMREQAARLRQS